MPKSNAVNMQLISNVEENIQREDAIESNKKDNSIYGSFILGTSEFALPVSVVQEVVNEPLNYTGIPLSPDYLLGIFHLRNSIIPVVSLAEIFNLDMPSRDIAIKNDLTESRKVAIIEHGNFCLGLLFDSTGEVFNNADVDTCLFDHQGDSIQEQVIAGVFKMDGGSRIVQLLDVAGMLQLDRIPQSAYTVSVPAHIRNRGKRRRQCISFLVGHYCCALDINAIREIVNIGPIKNTVLAGNLCMGAIDLRGNTVPVVNFGLLLGCDDPYPSEIQETDSHRVVIMTVGEHFFGLLVSQIQNIISYFKDELIPFPVLGNQKPSIFCGCIATTDNTTHTIVLDASEIFSNEEVLTISKGHSSLFKDSKKAAQDNTKESMQQQTLITFSLVNHYGLSIADVSEVVDYPGNLISTPSMSEDFHGMINLRGDLIAIIDTRKLYALEDFADYEASKVLVFEHEDTKYGLMVDTVDSILHFREDQSVGVPKALFNSDRSNIDQDIKEAIMVEEGESQKTICILDLAAIVKRVCSDNAPRQLRAVA